MVMYRMLGEIGKQKLRKDGRLKYVLKSWK